MKKTIIAFSAAAALLVCSGNNGVSADGAALFKANCAPCHGEDATNTTGGVHRLRGQTSEALQKKLAGYIDGSYGGPKKATMQRMVTKMSPEDLKSITSYLETLK